MSRSRFRMLVAGVVAVLALGVGSAAATPHAAKTSNAVNIRFQLSFFPSAQHAGFLVAAHRGYYNKEGLNVSVVNGGPSVNPSLVLSQGTVDMALVDFSEFLAAKSKGAPITFVSLVYHTDPVTYVSWKDNAITTPAQLKGKSFGVQAVGPVAPEMQCLLGKAGLTVNDIKVVPVGFTIADFVARKVDVYPARAFTHPQQFRNAGYAYPGSLAFLNPGAYGCALATQGVAVNDSFLKAHPGAVVGFLRAAIKGWKAAAANPDGAVDDVLKYLLPGTNPPGDTLFGILASNKLVAKSNNGKPYKKLLSIDSGALKSTYGILTKYKIVEPFPSWAKYVNTKLAAQAGAKLWAK